MWVEKPPDNYSKKYPRYLDRDWKNPTHMLAQDLVGFEPWATRVKSVESTTTLYLIPIVSW